MSEEPPRQGKDNRAMLAADFDEICCQLNQICNKVDGIIMRHSKVMSGYAYCGSETKAFGQLAELFDAVGNARYIAGQSHKVLMEKSHD